LILKEFSSPDLMPSDILGSEILDRQFKFIKGPIFSNIILAMKSIGLRLKLRQLFLRAMQERSVTYRGKTIS
jgi:MoxR-like ATPase